MTGPLLPVIPRLRVAGEHPAATATGHPAGIPIFPAVSLPVAVVIGRVDTLDQLGLSVWVVVNPMSGGVPNDDCPVAPAPGHRGWPLVQPAHGNGPAGINLGLNVSRASVGPEIGVQAKRPQRPQLGLGVGGVAKHGPDPVVGIIVGDLAPEHGQHGAAGAEALPISGAAGVVILALPLHIQWVGELPGHDALALQGWRPSWTTRA